MSAALRAINYFFHCEPIQVKKFECPGEFVKGVYERAPQHARPYDRGRRFGSGKKGVS